MNWNLTHCKYGLSIILSSIIFQRNRKQPRVISHFQVLPGLRTLYPEKWEMSHEISKSSVPTQPRRYNKKFMVVTYAEMTFAIVQTHRSDVVQLRMLGLAKESERDISWMDGLKIEDRRWGVLRILFCFGLYYAVERVSRWSCHFLLFFFFSCF